MGGPLSGIRVLEVANMLAAPSSTALMADMGADVIKVEPPTGDILRNAHRPLAAGAGPGPHPDPYFTVDNRGKRSIVVDLTKDEGVEVVQRLAEGVDIFLTNLTDDRRARYRLTPEPLLARNPRLVYTLLTGYGTRGPVAGKPGYDWTSFFARGGLSSLLVEPGQPPPAFRPGQGDHTSALALLASTLAALRERDNTGRGQVVEVALYQVAAWTLASDLAVALVDRADPATPARGEWPSPLTCRFRCADDRWIAFCMPGPRDFWDAFCVVLDRPDWVLDERYNTPEGRLNNARELIAECDAIFATQPRARWADLLDDAGLTWAPVQRLTEVIADPQAEALELFAEITEPGLPKPFRTVAAPFRMVGAEVFVRGPAPRLGAHTAQVLAAAGWDDAAVADLVARGIVSDGG